MKHNSNKQSAIDRFLKTTEPTTVKDSKKVVLDEREGLIERVDKILITKDGKQLLREQY
jgi:hypothetical protein